MVAVIILKAFKSGATSLFLRRVKSAPRATKGKKDLSNRLCQHWEYPALIC